MNHTKTLQPIIHSENQLYKNIHDTYKNRTTNPTQRKSSIEKTYMKHTELIQPSVHSENQAYKNKHKHDLSMHKSRLKHTKTRVGHTNIPKCVFRNVKYTFIAHQTVIHKTHFEQRQT